MGKDYVPLNGIPPDVWKSMAPKERISVRRKNYYLKNRDKILKHAREYIQRPEIKTKLLQYRRDYKKRPDVKLRQKELNDKYGKRLDEAPNSKGPRLAGTKTLKQFCYKLLHDMQNHLKRLKIENELEYTVETLIEISKTYDKFVVDEVRSFALRYTNGFFNSASIQRWDETKGYTIENTTPIPVMLQSRFAFTREQLRKIPSIIQQPTSVDLINEWYEDFKLNSASLFYIRAKGMKRSGKDFAFDSTAGAAICLRTKFIEAGGLCAYSGLPMRLIMNTGAFVMSVERLNPIYGYTPENIVLICSGLNSPIYGEHRQCRLTENGSEKHQHVVDLAKFNVDYWRHSMAYSVDDLAKIEETRAINRELMKTWPWPEIKRRAERKLQMKRARVEVVDDGDDDFALFG